MALPQLFQTKEVLNKVLNSGEDALKVDIDNVTLDGSQLSVDIDKENDSIVVYSNTTKDGSGTNYVPLVDSDGHLQVDVLSVTSSNVQGVNAEGGALPNPILIAGDDGTDLKNINVDATTGDVQVDVTNTITETNSADIKTAVETIDNAIDGTEMQVDIVADGAGLATSANQSTTNTHLSNMFYDTIVDGDANKSNTVDLTGAPYYALYVGVGGDVKVDLNGSGTFTFQNLASGQVLPIVFDRIYSTGTTATGLAGMK